MDAWDADPTPANPGAPSTSSSTTSSHPPLLARSSASPASAAAAVRNQSAAVLHGLTGGSASANGGVTSQYSSIAARGGVFAEREQPSSQQQQQPDPDDPSVEPVNHLNATMSALMQQNGAQGMKLKILRRAKNDQPGQPPHSGPGRSVASPEQKTSEQREREYEEARAAIFGGQIEALRDTASASPASSAASSGTTAGASSRILRRSPPVHSSSSPAGNPLTSGDLAPEVDYASEAAASQIQPSAAALAEVKNHHEKRHEKHQRVTAQQQHARAKASGGNHTGGGGAGGGGNSPGGGSNASQLNSSRQQPKNHRIIEDLVTNRAGNSRQQQSGGAYDDPDFGRRARIQQQPQQAYQGYQPAQNFMPQPYSQQQFAPALAYPSYPIANPSLSNAPGGGTPILPGNANSSNFAAGPTAAQGIGFGRGRSVAGQQSPPPASAGTTKLKASAPTFNPNAKAFNPSATPTYAPASSAPAASSSYYNTQPLLQPPPSSSQHGIFQFDPATNSFKAKTTAGGATTVPASVAMPAYATPNVYLGGQPNYYLTQQQQHQQGQR